MAALASPEPDYEIDPETGEYITDPKTGKRIVNAPIENRAQLERDMDRLRMILKRIEGFTKRIPDDDLEILLENTALLAVLDSAKRTWTNTSFAKDVQTSRGRITTGQRQTNLSGWRAEEVAEQEKMLTAEKPVAAAKPNLAR